MLNYWRVIGWTKLKKTYNYHSFAVGPCHKAWKVGVCCKRSGFKQGIYLTICNGVWFILEARWVSSVGRGFICCIDEGNLFAGSLFAGNLYESLNLRQVVFSKLPFCNVFLVNFSLPVAPMTRIWDELKPDITPGPRYLYWLVLWNMHFMTFPYIGNFIIPTDELHHFSEGLKPPTRE